LWVTYLIVNNQEHLLIALADTDASISISIILEVYTSVPIIKTDDNNTTPWSTMVGKFTTTKTGLVTFSLPEFNLKKQMCTSWEFHMDERSESSSTYDMIIGNQPRSSWKIKHNHEFQWPYSHLGYWYYSNEKQRCSILSSVETLIGVYMSANEPKTQTDKDEYSRATKILDAEYKQSRLDDVIKTCENLHIDKQHQLKILLQKYEHCLMKH
jgi:hypothetical protein